MKVCIKCSQEKQLEEFPINKTRKDGCCNICNECGKKYQQSLRDNKKLGIKLERKYRPSNKIIVEFKICRICNNTKNINEFYVKTTNKDNHKNICKKCDGTQIKIFRKLKIERYKQNKITVTEKKCLICQITKPSTEYNKRCEYVDGLEARCKSCDREYKSKWHEEHKEDMKLSDRRYRQSHKGKINGWTAQRRAARIQRIPKWITQEELQAIREFYKNCPKGMVVDHIAPLQGKTISGLHCLKNLQYLTPEENSRKSNKFNI